MPLNPEESIKMVDGEHRYLGDVSIHRIEGTRVCGEFVASSQFSDVQPLFGELEEAVNEQMFSLADQLCSSIDQLKLQFLSPDGSDALQISDVQIMNGHDFSCRVHNLGLTQFHPTVAEAV